jgi:geranylgeranyl reductase
VTAQANRLSCDVAVIGGGPSGATAAHELAASGYSVVLLDRLGRTKPCGGAIPPRLIDEFDIPEHLLAARVTAADVVAPSSRRVRMPIENGFVGMVDRADFDPWLRERAVCAGANLIRGQFVGLTEHGGGPDVRIFYETNDAGARTSRSIFARAVIGADGADSKVAKAGFDRVEVIPRVAAYHEIVSAPRRADFDGSLCEVYYQGVLSPDFYGWVFPHGDSVSVGAGSAIRGFSLRTAVAGLRRLGGLAETQLIRREGAPIPLRARRRWDNGRNVLLAGDAAGVVAPASGEGIYYAMVSGRYAAGATNRFLESRNPRELRRARAEFLSEHGRVFRMLGLMQKYWYSSDQRRERFVRICDDRDVQRLTWQAYMNKRLEPARISTHARIFFKNIAHLAGILPA